MKTISHVISRLFDPILEIPVAILLAIWVAIGEGLRWRFLGLLLFIDLLVPFIFFLTMLYHRQIKDWDVRNRRERIPLYFFTMLCHLGGVWLANMVGKNELAAILTVFWILGVIFALVTAFWKISIHAGVNTVLIVFVNVLFGWQYWPLFLLIPVVGWARVYGKHHSLWQFVAGSILGGSVAYLALKTIGF